MHFVLSIVVFAVACYCFYAAFRSKTGSGKIVQKQVSGSNAMPFPRVAGAAVLAVDDPVTGAAIIMAAIANLREPLDAATRTVIKDELREATGADPEAAMEYAGWAIAQAPDPDNISMRLSAMWKKNLNEAERRQLADMVLRVASMRGEPTPEQADAIELLRSRLEID